MSLHRPTRRAAVLALAAAPLASTLLGGAARAQSFPTKPIRLVVPYPPGGPTDVLARLVANEIGPMLGGNVVVENVPGASGAVGTRQVARAEADGHTIMAGNNQTHGSNVFLVKDLAYDALKDFAPIAGTVDLQHALVVRKDLAAKDVAELVALMKRDGSKLNYGSTGNGSGSHLAMELFKINTGGEAQHVPFRGAAPLAQEIVAGRIDLAFSTLSAVLPQVEAGAMRALAIASDNPAPQLPNVPLLKSAGVRDNEFDSWNAMFAPAGTPPAVLERLSRAVLEALAKPALREAALKQGILVNARTPAAWSEYHRTELAKLERIVRVAKVQADG